MELAKQALDVGLYTNNPDAMLEFWQGEVGAAFDETLPVGGGVHQLRHRLGESIIKINHSRSTLPASPPGGFRSLRIAQPTLREPRHLTDPDGTPVTLVPAGLDDVSQLELTVVVQSLPAQLAFYEHALGLERTDELRFRCGASLIRLREDPSLQTHQDMRASGLRYITLQVYNVVGEHARILAAGGHEGRSPVRLGDVAHISFICDPEGNWIELSQRKSITGSLD